MTRHTAYWHRIVLVGQLSTLATAGMFATGCEQSIGKTVQNLQSLAVVLKSPSPDDLGTPDNPISPTEVVFDVRAIDSNGQPYVEDLEADVFLAFSGNRIGKLTPCGTDEDKTPLAHIQLRGGVATDRRVPLARYYGKVALWVEEQAREDRNVRGFGASPEMTFRSPTIPDIQKPLDENAPTATYCTPFSGKQVTIVNATGTGQLVVTSVFPNAYVVTDTGAPYDRATGQGGYNSLFVFTFGSPPFFIEAGRVLGRVGGNISKFVGFTELNFPYQDPASVNDLVQVPLPFELLAADRGKNIMLLRLAASTVKTTARICPIDVNSDNWKQFQSVRPQLRRQLQRLQHLPGGATVQGARYIRSARQPDPEHHGHRRAAQLLGTERGGAPDGLRRQERLRRRRLPEQYRLCRGPVQEGRIQLLEHPSA